MFSWPWIFSAMFWFYIMNPENVFILLSKLSQPWTPRHIGTSFRVYPNVINIMTVPNGYWINPVQNIKSSFYSPHCNILTRDTCLKRIAEVETAVTALYAFEIFRWHSGPFFVDYVGVGLLPEASCQFFIKITLEEWSGMISWMGFFYLQSFSPGIFLHG